MSVSCGQSSASFRLLVRPTPMHWQRQTKRPASADAGLDEIPLASLPRLMMCQGHTGRLEALKYVRQSLKMLQRETVLRTAKLLSC